VELVNGKKAVTLVLMGKYVRDWGFITKKGWKQWQEYFRELGC
jgi:molybdate-binding protein